MLAATLALWIGVISVAHAGPRSISIRGPGEDGPYCSDNMVEAKAAKRWSRQSLAGLREADIAARGPEMEILVKATWLRGVRRLLVCTDSRGLRALAKVGFTALRDLSVAYDRHGESDKFEADAISVLVSARGLRRLTHLRIAGSEGDWSHNLDDVTMRALVSDAVLPQLVALDVSRSLVSVDTVAILLHSPLAQQLTELNACRTAAAVNALIDARLTRLERLCLSKLHGDPLSDAARARIDQAYPGVLAPELDDP